MTLAVQRLETNANPRSPLPRRTSVREKLGILTNSPGKAAAGGSNRTPLPPQAAGAGKESADRPALETQSGHQPQAVLKQFIRGIPP